ncbi:MAG: hypothetical protein KIT75_09545 [Planctomycetota bacterium]|nr:hypothetical protein [Planctomycetota bacterium]
MDLPPEITQPREYLLAAIRRRWMREPIADFVENNRAILDTGKAELDRAKANPDSRLRVSIAALQRSLAVHLAACELEVQSELLVMRDANRLLGEDSPHRGAALHSVFAGAASEERFALLLDKLQPRTLRARAAASRAREMLGRDSR